MVTLSETAKQYFDTIQKEYDIHDSAGKLLLQTVCESYDQYQAALKICETEGYVIQDRWGQTKPNPATTIMRDSKSAMITAIKALNLDFSTIEKPLKTWPA